MLPELIGLSTKFAIQPKIKMFEGVEGMKLAYRDILTTSNPILALL